MVEEDVAFVYMLISKDVFIDDEKIKAFYTLRFV
jgi:hypothetical protein